MRVNLLDSIETGAFAGLTNLRRLSLAGNFLRESVLENDIWQGLKSLEHLDLGWNEFTRLPANGFASLGPSLTSLNLRHNDILLQVRMLAAINRRWDKNSAQRRNFFRLMLKLSTGSTD